MIECPWCVWIDWHETRRGLALDDLAHVVWHGWEEAYLIMDDDCGLSWWARIDGTEDVRALALKPHSNTPTRGGEKA